MQKNKRLVNIHWRENRVTLHVFSVYFIDLIQYTSIHSSIGVCVHLDIHTCTKCHMYDTYNKQGQIIWSCKRYSQHRTKDQGGGTQTLQTCNPGHPYCCLGMRPASVNRTERQQVFILALVIEKIIAFILPLVIQFSEGTLRLIHYYSDNQESLALHQEINERCTETANWDSTAWR